jgi:hypothetical protein
MCCTGPADPTAGAAGRRADRADTQALVSGQQHVELLRLLHGCSTSALALSGEISRRLFSHVGSGDHQVWQ